ncbi:MAG: glycosyltransferase [Solirubrobacteraceae bacterium]
MITDQVSSSPTSGARIERESEPERERESASEREPEREFASERESERVDISVLIPVLNEERHIREAVVAMQAQQLDGVFELLFADGHSTDRTREILLELAQEDPRIRVLSNPIGHTASGLNICLSAARGEFVARMDAHTYYPPRYLAAGIERLRQGDTVWVSGPQVPWPTGPISRAVSLALASWLGRGGSRKWSEDDADGGEEHDLDTGVFGGVWRREVVLDIGGWDERWPINQDSEMAARFLRRGERLVCIPAMAARYTPRDSLRGLARQYFRYGQYRARTFRHHPHSMRPSHLIAPALAGALLATVLAPRFLRRPARFAIAAYLAAVGATAATTAMRREQRTEGALLTAALPTMHFAWGFGTLVGMIRFGLPTAALAALVGRKPIAADASRDAEPVYAPSLRREAA